MTSFFFEYFATAMPMAGYASGLLVVSHMGRPTKVEGNPAHPSNAKPDNAPPHARFGPSDLYAQASVLTLYDPNRSPSLIQFQAEKLAAWLKKGAQPTQTVAQLIRKSEAAPTA